jgi:hypothetical protein
MEQNAGEVGRWRRMRDPVTAEDINKYLETQNDFDLELFAKRTLLDHGIPARHGATYVDPVTEKPRQFDLRATKQYTSYPLGTAISLAIECKSLSADFPLIVSAVPRPADDSYHELIESQGGTGMGSAIRVSDSGTLLYPPSEWVGKKTTQIRVDGKGFAGGDSETYDKWAQALASAADLVREACDVRAQGQRGRFCTLVLPVLVVSDGTLWMVPYTEQGVRGDPSLVDTVNLFVERQYRLEWGGFMRISHLHIYTRSGFGRFIDDLVSPNSSNWERSFGRVIRERLGRG